MKDIKKDDALRREYWSKQMDSAYDFMQKMSEYPVEECGEAMVSVRQAVKDARLTVKFDDTKIAGKYERVFYLREGLIKKFLAVAKAMNDLGWFLKVEDCFRTRNMQKHVGLQKGVFDKILKKVIWENNGKIPSPELMFKRFTALIATSAKIGTHISGSAIDISVYKASNLNKMDRGGPYLEMSELTFMDSPFISDKAAANRKEINKILYGIGLPLVCLSDLPKKFKLVENGYTFLENALKKTLPVSRVYRNDYVLGEDSGLEVDFLDGAPGIYSKRYSGRNSTYQSNNKKLIQTLKNVPLEKRKANFRCCLVLVKNGKLVKEFNGILEGIIHNKPEGVNGFGYDPVFYLPKYKKTAAQISPALKNRISHRGKAFRKLKRYLLEKRIKV